MQLAKLIIALSRRDEAEVVRLDKALMKRVTLPTCACFEQRVLIVIFPGECLHLCALPTCPYMMERG